MNARIDKLRAQLEEPMLVSDSTNVLYLTGLHSTNAAVFVEEERLRLFTDFRYLEKARALDEIEIVEVPRNLYTGIPQQLAGRVAFEDTLSYAAYAALAAGGLELVPRHHVIERLRAVKDAGELEAIRGATAITNEMYARLPEQRFVGRTERDLAWWIESTFHELGAEGLAFEVHVNAGANGAAPHGDTTDRTIEPNELVIVDTGAKLADYCSDCTRTFATGELPDELVRAYDVCLRAQEAALAEYRPGARTHDVDQVARTIIDGEGFAGLFGHGLGHGVGLFIHELPALRPEEDDVLEAGHVASCEPGIYKPGIGGIRIEDLVVVTDDGPEVLTNFTKELVTVR
jgi:Xaa-Pro aminopeptidase